MNLTPEQFQTLGEAGVADEIIKATEEFYRRKEEQIGTELMTMLEKMAMLQVIDNKWRDHLREMDDLKEGIHLRGYGQKDPLVEYKGEAFKMFIELMEFDCNRCSQYGFQIISGTARTNADAAGAQADAT